MHYIVCSTGAARSTEFVRSERLGNACSTLVVRQRERLPGSQVRRLGMLTGRHLPVAPQQLCGYRVALGG